ncbi:MAG: hypothetical protein ACRCYU_20040 [Nocardioides sp.]
MTAAAVPTLINLSQGFYAVAFNTAVVGVQALVVSVIVLCLVWHVLARAAGQPVASRETGPPGLI